METPTFVLFEHAVGYSLFRLTEFEEIGSTIQQVEDALKDVGKLTTILKLVAFSPFQNAAHALENCNTISEGAVHPDLFNFLETNVPKEKKAKTKLGISDSKLAAGISESLPHIHSLCSGIVPEVLRCIRSRFDTFIKGLTATSCGKAQLGLGHSYSRARVKFNVNRVDNMIIQSIALLDQLDKDINTFSMRIREWYSYHFPELFKLVPDQYMYCCCAKLIQDRKNLTEELIPSLTEVVMDEGKAREILFASHSSMGMDISELDLMNIERFATRVAALAEYRRDLQAYLKEKMSQCAPSLSALIGEQVGARLISHAGSLTNLAKYPASTVQILGAEKALFRALKTKGNTPKYGLLFHSTFIGRASAKNKGRISRYLANKCSLASRIDCFSELPVPTFDRLKFFETGDPPKKNQEVMHQATLEAVETQAKLLKKQRKKEKKAKRAEAEAEHIDGDTPAEPEKKRKKKSSEGEAMATAEDVEVSEPTKKKKKKERVEQETFVETPTENVAELSASKKKKKKHVD